MLFNHFHKAADGKHMSQTALYKKRKGAGAGCRVQRSADNKSSLDSRQKQPPIKSDVIYHREQSKD